MSFKIGELKPCPPGADWFEEVWPVLVDGVEVAEIVGTEDGYRLRRNGAWAGAETERRDLLIDQARAKFGEGTAA